MVKRKYLIEAAKDLSGIIDFDIPIDKIEEYDDETIRDEIIEAASVLEDGDKLLETTVDVLEELEIDVPAGIKIVKNKKQEKAREKQPEKKKSGAQKNVGKTNKKAVNKKVKKVTKEINEYGNKICNTMLFLAATSLIEEEKYTRKEIIELLMNNETISNTRSTIETILTDGKRKEWCKFRKLIIVDENKIMKFED